MTLVDQQGRIPEHGLSQGDPVVVRAGTLAGLEGTLVDLPADGRVSVALGLGVYVQMPSSFVTRCG